MIHKPSTNTDQRKHKIQTEQVSLDKFFAAVRHTGTPDPANFYLGFASEEMHRNLKAKRPWEIKEIVQDHGDGDDECLTDFRAIYSGQNINAISGERGEK
jgi:hypothetical protein